MANVFENIRPTIPETDSSGSEQNQYWLSVLIPAYEHPLGVLRILDILQQSNIGGVECLVSDDSQSIAVEAAIVGHSLYKNGSVSYFRNIPALGAVINWNSLIVRSRGEYLLLMHHDECPERIDFFSVLKQQLTISVTPDVLLLQCLLPTMGGYRLRYHVPHWLRRQFMRFGPEHLLRHNTLGSPSVVVVRRRICLPFDETLKWLVDVEWMVRLLRQPKVRCLYANQLAVVSIPNKATSITRKLGSEIPRLRDDEARMICRKLGPMFVFTLLLPSTIPEKLFAGVEFGFWFSLRVMTRGTSWLFSRPFPVWLRNRVSG